MRRYLGASRTPSVRLGTTRTRTTLVLRVVVAALALLALPLGACRAFAEESLKTWAPLIDRLAAEGLDRTAMTRIFAEGDVEFDPAIMAGKVDAMVRKRFEPQPPVTAKTLEKSGYRRFLTPWTLNWAGRFMAENKTVMEQAENAYGVPREVITAILLVETKLGSYLGEKNAFSVLASMALCENFSLIEGRLRSVRGKAERLEYARRCAKDKADWAFAELAALIRYAGAVNTPPTTIPGSVYGAVGICQFMPSNALKFGVDADADGRIDLFANSDAIHSVANYLRGHGWAPGLDREGQKNVIFAYNHSDLYVLAVLTVADRLRTLRLGKAVS